VEIEVETREGVQREGNHVGVLTIKTVFINHLF
jgi:hypothetical protein